MLITTIRLKQQFILVLFTIIHILMISSSSLVSLSFVTKSLDTIFRKIRHPLFLRTSNHKRLSSCRRLVSQSQTSFQSSSYMILNRFMKNDPLNFHNQSTSCRFMGSKRGIPENPPGMISIYNEQETLQNLNIKQLKQTLFDIRNLLGYTTYDVTLILIDDEEMIRLNTESRGIQTPTDILSFPFQDVIIEPGNLDEPDFDFPDYYNLGDLFIDVPYVIRRCKQDQQENMGDDTSRMMAQHDDSSSSSKIIMDNYERGVSGAMSTIYNPEQRIHMLLIHGMLHLVGYDHIEDEDYELMVQKEEEILHKLNMRIKTREGQE